MKKLLAFLCAMMLILSVGGIAAADVLTFDDIVPSTTTLTDGLIPDGYGGFNWDNMYWGHGANIEIAYPSSYYVDGVVSGDFIAFNGWIMSAAIDDGQFDFVGAYFSAAWVEETLNVTAYRSGFEVDSQSYQIYPGIPTFLQFDMLGIDELVLSSATGLSQFVMDDFTYNRPVPEPATMLLLGTGLMGMAVIGRKKIFPKK